MIAGAGTWVYDPSIPALITTVSLPDEPSHITHEVGEQLMQLLDRPMYTVVEQVCELCAAWNAHLTMHCPLLRDGEVVTDHGVIAVDCLLDSSEIDVERLVLHDIDADPDAAVCHGCLVCGDSWCELAGPAFACGHHVHATTQRLLDGAVWSAMLRHANNVRRAVSESRARS